LEDQHTEVLKAVQSAVKVAMTAELAVDVPRIAQDVHHRFPAMQFAAIAQLVKEEASRQGARSIWSYPAGEAELPAQAGFPKPRK